MSRKSVQYLFGWICRHPDWRHYVFACPSHILPRLPSRVEYISLRKDTEQIAVKFVEGNGRNWYMNKGAGYERKLKSTSIGLAAVSHGC